MLAFLFWPDPNFLVTPQKYYIRWYSYNTYIVLPYTTPTYINFVSLIVRYILRCANFFVKKDLKQFNEEVQKINHWILFYGKKYPCIIFYLSFLHFVIKQQFVKVPTDHYKSEVLCWSRILEQNGKIFWNWQHSANMSLTWCISRKKPKSQCCLNIQI